MAIVVGGRIINLPQEDLSGLLGGIGEIVKGIRTQRQQTRENQIFTDLSRTLQGDVTPQGGVGPVRPAITDPQERLNAILNTALSGKVRSPQGLNRLLGIAQIQERAIPTAGTGVDPIQSLIFKNPKTGTEQKIRGRRSLAFSNPNINFPEVETETPAQFEVIQDPTTGELFRIDKLNPDKPPVPVGVGGATDAGQTVSDKLTEIDTREGALTTEDVSLATGPVSKARSFLAKFTGGFIPGTQFPKTQDARQKVGLINTRIRRIFSNNPRFPVADRKQIDESLVDTNKIFVDPPFAFRAYLNIRNIAESDNAQMESTLRGRTTKNQRQEIIEKINDNNQILNLIPSRTDLENAINPLASRDFSNITKEGINKLTKEDVDNLSSEQIRQIRERAVGLGIQ